MRNDVLQQLSECGKKHYRRKRRIKIVTCLAAVVVFCTTYALILPAVTLEKETCGIPEHTHSDECYEQVTKTVKELICSPESLDIHEHTDDCYDEDGNLICGSADFAVHEHDSSCYDEDGSLCCTLPEVKAHTHDESCYSESGGSDTSASDDPELVCGKEEIILHEHNENCFDGDGTLICGKTEILEHIHSEGCFRTVEETETNLICGMEEHTHSQECQGMAESESESEIVQSKQDETQSEQDEAQSEQDEAQSEETDDKTGDEAQDQKTDTDRTEQGDMAIILPEGAEIPEGYDEEYSYVDSDNRFGVKVYAPADALPEGAELYAELLDEDSEGYTAAREALNHMTVGEGEEPFSYDGFAALDIHFEADSQEVEPLKAVYVCINASGLLPENADPDTVAVQHHLESVSADEVQVVTVADNTDEGGIIEAADNADMSSVDISTAFTLDSFSTITTTYSLNAAAANAEVSRASSGDIYTQDNVFPVSAVNVWDDNADVILVYPAKFQNDIGVNSACNLEKCFGNQKFEDWCAVRIEKRGSGDQARYTVLQAQDPAEKTLGVQKEDAYILLVRKTYMTEQNMYFPAAEWTDSSENNKDYSGDTADINLASCQKTDQKQSDGTVYAYVTFSPKNATGDPGSKATDKDAVAEDAIKFQLFNYSENINYKNGEDGNWRTISDYFGFRGISSAPVKDINNEYDEDGFTLNHATVERTLLNNYPVLDLKRKADGTNKTSLTSEPSQTERSLAYLFGGASDGAVTVYNPANTVLQKNGTHYYYNSRDNAVDYDLEENMFRVRGYKERNSSTAGYGSAQTYYDFLPFNYTDGIIVGTSGSDGRTYNLSTNNVDYWFGMRMDVEFYQYKGGKYEGSDMVFSFSGDDDVWVFIDDVLVLDLGGTHGAVSGSINFATGEIEQYLDWDGEDGRKTGKSYPTTLKACYEAAGKDPNGGWNGDIFSDYTSHKLSFFYMERGAAVANCSLDFNLPTLPEKALQVTKELTAGENSDQSVAEHLKDTMEYKFRVVKADQSGNPGNELLIKENETYTLSGTGVTDENKTGVVGADGYFTLKSGQTAEFTNMLARFDNNDTVKKYYVQEVMPAGLKDQYKDVVYTVDSSTGSCTMDTSAADFIGFNTPLLEADTGNLVAYKNVVNTEKLSKLQIKKEQVGSSVDGNPDWYYIKVLLGPDESHLSPVSEGMEYTVGSETRTAGKNGVIKLKSGETAELKLLAGICYQVEEVSDEEGNQLTGSEKYTPEYTNKSGTITDVGSTVQVIVTNTYRTGDLNLTKTINDTNGSNTSGEFEFEIRFAVSSGWENSAYGVVYANSITEEHIHTDEDGKLGFTKVEASLESSGSQYYAVSTVKLYHGETVKITGMPADAQISINEMNGDGYSTSWTVGEQTTYGNAVTVAFSQDSEVVVQCINTAGTELPQTGGAGTGLYTIGGILLMSAAAFLLLYTYNKCRRKNKSAF